MSHKVALVAAIVLGLYTLTTILMKLIRLRRAELEGRAFAPQAAGALREKNLTEALKNMSAIQTISSGEGGRCGPQ